MTTWLPSPKRLWKASQAKAAERATRKMSRPIFEDPGVPDHLQADADGGQEDGGEGQQEPDGVIADGDALAEPDGRIAEVAEDEGGGELEQVMAVQDLAAEDHLREDEHQVHHPGQGADGEEAPAEVEHGRRAGNRGGSEVGFEGQGDADGDEDEAEGRDSVPFEYVFCAIIHIFANWTAGDKAVRKFAQKSVNKQRI